MLCPCSLLAYKLEMGQVLVDMHRPPDYHFDSLLVNECLTPSLPPGIPLSLLLYRYVPVCGIPYVCVVYLVVAILYISIEDVTSGQLNNISRH